MSDVDNSSLSPIVYCDDTVFPFLNASIIPLHQLMLVIHNSIIHPWSTLFERKGPCSKNTIAPMGATGTGLLESNTISKISMTYTKN